MFRLASFNCTALSFCFHFAATEGTPDFAGLFDDGLYSCLAGRGAISFED